MVREGVGSSEIVVIPNQYKDTLGDLIDSSDPEFLNRMGPMDERSYNTPIIGKLYLGLIHIANLGST